MLFYNKTALAGNPLPEKVLDGQMRNYKTACAHTVPKGFTDAALSGRKFFAGKVLDGQMRNYKTACAHTVPKGFTDAALSGRKFFAGKVLDGQMRNYK